MPADEVNVDFADRLRNLPDRFESIDQVRELAGQLRVAGMLRKVREIRLTTLDDQPALSQSGRNQPRNVATNSSPHPRPRAARSPRPDPASPDAGPPAPTSEPSNESDSIITNSITYEQLGTVIELLPRIDSTGSVHVQFSYNSSDAEKAPEVTLSEVPGRKPLIADKVVTHQIHSTVRLSAGMAVIVQRDSTQTFEGNSPTSTTQLVILAASVEPAIE